MWDFVMCGTTLSVGASVSFFHTSWITSAWAWPLGVWTCSDTKAFRTHLTKCEKSEMKWRLLVGSPGFLSWLLQRKGNLVTYLKQLNRLKIKIQYKFQDPNWPTFDTKQFPQTPIPRITGPVIDEEAILLSQNGGFQKNPRQNIRLHIALRSENSKDLGPASWKKK